MFLFLWDEISRVSDGRKEKSIFQGQVSNGILLASQTWASEVTSLDTELSYMNTSIIFPKVYAEWVVL